MKIDIVETAKEVFKDKKLIIEEVEGSKIKIWYKRRGRYPKPFIFPKSLNLDFKFGQFCGLYYGEGANSQLSWTQHSQFTNSDPRLVKTFLNFMEERFDFNRNRFSYRAYATKNKISPKEEERVKKYWRSELNLERSTAIKVYTQSREGKFKDRIMVTLGSVIFRKMLDEFIKMACEISLTCDEVRRGFLSGLFAGEGFVALKGKSLFCIGISQGYKDAIKDRLFGRPKREFIKKLLKCEKISPNNTKKGINVFVTDLRNLKRFRDLNLHELHLEKFKKFEKGFLNLSSSKRAGISNNEAKYQILNLLFKNGPLSVEEISKFRGTKEITNSEILKGRKDRRRQGLLDKGYITLFKKVKQNHSKKPISLWSLTDMGQEYLDHQNKFTYNQSKKS